MPKRPAVTTLQASTIDILNTIRQNASLEYQDLVPQVTVEKDIPKVGEVLYGYPNLANQFINALVNRIALVRVKSMAFNNPYAPLKKGFLEYGETVEEVFVNIAKVRTFSVEKAAEREFKRTLPDVRSAFHAMNYRVQYPITIQDQDLHQAFLSLDGVQELIAKIVDSVYKAAEYDEFLLFKYMLIKGITHGQIKPIGFNGAVFSDTAVSFRETSNLFTFPTTEYNESGVLTNTPRGNQIIFMDSAFNARFDVDILASAFNMGKAEYLGQLMLMDHWDRFDNERFLTIQQESDMLPPVTQEELALMKNVTAVLIDSDWFQVYDNHARFVEDYVAAGEYWNYFYNVWKTISHSPFANAVVLVDEAALNELPASITFTVSDKSQDANATVLSIIPKDETKLRGSYKLVQNEACTTAGIAVHPYGAIIFPVGATGQTMNLMVDGVLYASAAVVNPTSSVGGNITFNKVVPTAITSDCLTPDAASSKK